MDTTAQTQQFPATLKKYYRQDLDLDGDSSFQLALISDPLFEQRITHYIEVIKHFSDLDIRAFIESSSDFKTFDLRDQLHGLKEAHRIAFRSVAFEYRALLAAVDALNFQPSTASFVQTLCSRCIASMFNSRYHKFS